MRVLFTNREAAIVHACAHAVQVVFPWKGWIDCTSTGKKSCAGHRQHVQASSPFPHFLRGAEGRAGLKTLRSFKKMPELLQ